MKSALPEFAPDRPTWRWPTTLRHLRTPPRPHRLRRAPGTAERRGAGRGPLRSLPGRRRVRPRARAAVAIVLRPPPRAARPRAAPPPAAARSPSRPPRAAAGPAGAPRAPPRRRRSPAPASSCRWRASASTAAAARASSRAQNRRRACASPARSPAPATYTVAAHGAPWRPPPRAASTSPSSRASFASAARRAAAAAASARSAWRSPATPQVEQSVQDAPRSSPVTLH